MAFFDGKDPKQDLESDHTVDRINGVPRESFVVGNSLYARSQRVAGKLKIEQRGIERVPENERTDTNLIKVGTMWVAVNMVISSFATGTLGPKVFKLGFVDSCLTILFINLLGITPVCFYSTFGPKFGLRQMILSRFYFGWYAVKIIAVFSILTCLGWSAVNVIAGAQLLNTVSGAIPGYAGIIIMAVGTFIVTLFGYKIVHVYEKWSWVPCFIIFLIIVGEFAHSKAFVNIPMGRGKAEIGSVLSFASSIFGFATGWTSIAADYTVYQPVTTSRIKVFFSAWVGLIFPLLFTQMLGAAVMCAGIENPAYKAAYARSGNGGLLGQALIPPLGRFGEFCLVVLALSTIANNCPNIYSVSLTLQVLARQSRRVPRFVWVLISTLISIAIAIPGYSHFEEVLVNFMLLIGYWVAIYEGIALSEHFIFRRGIKGYTPEDYLSPVKLPPGIAATGALCFGIFGAVMGMAQKWFVGPIGKRIGGDFGGDIGFELAFAFAFTTYTGFRWLEKKRFGR